MRRATKLKFKWRRSRKAMLITAVGGTLSLLLLGGGASAALGGTLHPLSSSDIELQRSLVGWWRLDGNVNDSTPYRNNGTVNGATLTTDKAGNANSAYQLGNSAAWINVGSPAAYSNLTTSGFTYSVWLARGNASVAQWPEIMGANNTHVYYGIRSQNFGSNISFEYGNGVFDGASGHFTSASFGACSSPTVGSWHFYVVTYSGTTLTTYCDGNLVGMATATLDPTFGGLAFTQGSSGWVGSMDAPRVYDRALSLSEVQTLYESSY